LVFLIQNLLTNKTLIPHHHGGSYPFRNGTFLL
jgi:hypothetical protein